MDHDMEDSFERNEELDKIIINFTSKNEDEVEIILKSAQKSLTFLNVYKNELELLENQLLSHLMPCILNNIEKILNENSSISETTGDDFIVDIQKSNLETAGEFLNILKDVLSFLEGIECNFKDLKSLPVNCLTILQLSFKHCQDRQIIYGDKFKNELLKFFRTAENAFLLFLKLFDGEFLDLQTLNQILQHFYKVTEILAIINMKLMSTAWKHFLAIVAKYFQNLSDFNMQFFVENILNNVVQNFKGIADLDSNNLQIESAALVKVTAFLVKVCLKLFDIFWKFIDDCLVLIVKFVITASNYSIHLQNIISEINSQDIVNMMESMIFQNINGFTWKLINEQVIEKFFEKYSSQKEALDFLNIILVLKIASNKNGDRAKKILTTLFAVVEKSSATLILNKDNIFDHLLINTTAFIIMALSLENNAAHSQEIGNLLLRNVFSLQRSLWAALFALEIITLLLKNVDNASKSIFLKELAEGVHKCNFGHFTAVPERVFVNSLIQRISKLCPKSAQIDANQILVNCVRFESGKKSFTELNCKEFLNLIKLFNVNSAYCDGIINESVFDLWQFNGNASEEIANNNFFYLFSLELIKRTILHLPAATIGQLILILTQLNRLCTHSRYKLQTCDFLLALSVVKPAKILQNDQISGLTSSIIAKLLKNSSNELIRLKTCALINNLSKILEIQRNFTDDKTIQGEINYYLSCCTSGNINNWPPLDKQSIFDGDLYPFQHICVEWKENDISPGHASAKRLKIDETSAKEVQQLQEEASNQDDDMSEILARIKGELKCLERACKSRSLSQDNGKASRKNVADIKAIIAKLETFLN